jgi:F-type H+-transporting ATPase subunit delta
MKISKQNRRDAKDLFRACLVNGVLDENRVRQIVDEVLRVKPRSYAGILEHFQRLLKLDEARRAATVESATDLSPDLQNEFKTKLEKRYGKGLRYTFVQNPQLLGGVRIQVGSDVYDDSVAARLAALKESF